MADRQGYLVGRSISRIQQYATEILDLIEGAIKKGTLSYDALYLEPSSDEVVEVEESDLDDDETALTLDFSQAKFDPEEAARQAVEIAASMAASGNTSF